MPLCFVCSVLLSQLPYYFSAVKISENIVDGGESDTKHITKHKWKIIPTKRMTTVKTIFGRLFDVKRISQAWCLYQIYDTRHMSRMQTIFSLV